MLVEMLSSAGGGGQIVNTEKLLTSSEALDTVYYMFTRAYKFVRLRITRNSVATQGSPTLRMDLTDAESDNIANGSTFAPTVNTRKTAVFFDVPVGAQLTVKRTSTSGSAARYSEFDIDMYN